MNTPIKDLVISGRVMTESNVKRFWSHVDKNGPTSQSCPDLGACWLWKTTSSENYGKLYIKDRVFHAQRVSYLIHNGSIGDHLVVCHSCDTPGCVNPAHLFQGTSKDNSQDRSIKGRSRKIGNPNPSKGMAHSMALKKCIARSKGRHHFSPLSPDDVVAIREMNERNVVQSEIAKMYGVSQAAISHIVLRKSWRSVA